MIIVALKITIINEVSESFFFFIVLLNDRKFETKLLRVNDYFTSQCDTSQIQYMHPTSKTK